MGAPGSNSVKLWPGGTLTPLASITYGPGGVWLNVAKKSYTTFRNDNPGPHCQVAKTARLLHTVRERG